MITTMRARSFGPDAAAVRSARAFVVDVVIADGLGELAERVALVTSELASNAVLHARTDFVVHVGAVGPSARVAVFDCSDELPVDRGFDAAAVTGRGLSIVESLADRWGVDVVADGTGKWVWAELDPSPGART
jgi:anti-sigma regulatory factor (Ser/Thr protein kinase)